MIRAFVKVLVPPPIHDSIVLNYSRFRMYFRDFSSNPPIIIYQIGKVGSKTVLRSLEI